MPRRITWKCNYCCSIQTSDSGKRWDMTVCSCGESALDLEEWYSREMGDIEYLKSEEYEVEKRKKD